MRAPTPEAGPTLYERIYGVVRRIPRGRVSTYGRVAKAVNTGARQVGYAMASLPPGSNVPWHRVINHRGEISLRKDGLRSPHQRRLLEAEGVSFDPRGRINLKQFLWP